MSDGIGSRESIDISAIENARFQREIIGFQTGVPPYDEDQLRRNLADLGMSTNIVMPVETDIPAERGMAHVLDVTVQHVADIADRATSAVHHLSGLIRRTIR